MKKYNVIFCGTVRDCEKYIKKTLDDIEICGRKFNDFCVIIYENDSKDETREILYQNKKPNYYYLFEDNVNENRRTMRLANGRNKILEKTRELNHNKYYDYLIVLDMDDVNIKGSFIKTIETCFEYDDKDWDVLTGNQTGSYYDVWALRKEYDYNKDFVIYDNNIPPYRHYEQNGLLEVNSAFGGIAIYKLSSIPKECEYVGEYKQDSIKPNAEKCEHVDFNECIKNSGGKIFINTDFLTN